MKEYRVGKIIDSFVNHQEGALFDISDGGANLLYFLDIQQKKRLNNLIMSLK